MRSRVANDLSLEDIAPDAGDFNLMLFSTAGLLQRSGILRWWNFSKVTHNDIDLEIAEIDFVIDRRPMLLARLMHSRPRHNWLTT